MIRELLAHNDYVRVLNAIERRTMRLTKLIAPKIADTATGLPLTVYSLTDRGVAFKEAFFAFVRALKRRRARLGAETLIDLRKWWT